MGEISIQDGALALYEIFYGDRQKAFRLIGRVAPPRPARRIETVPESRWGGASPKPPQKRIKLRCRACGRRKTHAARGLCGRCYYEVRKIEKGA